MKIIINADDFGLTSGVTYGIFDAMKNKLITSTTMMMNMESTTLASELVKKYDYLNVGLHLNISLGKPLTKCPSLTNEEGYFIKPKNLESSAVYSEEEIFKEFEAQYLKFVEINNKKPTHIDSHLYVHQIYEVVRKQIIKLSNKYHLPIREYSNDYYEGVYFCKDFKVYPNDTVNSLKEKLVRIIEENKDKEIVEIMVHPGFIDDQLLTISSYNVPRCYEYACLNSDEIKTYFKRNHQLISYKDVKGKRHG